MGSQSSSMRSSDTYDQSQNVSSQYGNANNVHTSGNVTITDASPEIVGKAFDFGSMTLTQAVNFGQKTQDNMLTFTDKITSSLQNSQNTSLKAIENLKTDGANTVKQVAIITGLGIVSLALITLFIKTR